MIGMRRKVKRLTGDSALWSVCVKLAAPHSTQGELYHNPCLQTKHTGANKDNSVPTLTPCTTAHRWLLYGTVPLKTSCDLHSYQERATFSHLSVLLWLNKLYTAWHQIMTERHLPQMWASFFFFSFFYWPHEMLNWCIESGVIKSTSCKPTAWHWCKPGWVLIDHINERERGKKSHLFFHMERSQDLPHVSSLPVSF